MNRSLRSKLLLLGLSFLMAFGLTTPVAAQGLVTGDTIPAGTVYDHDAILIGENVVIDGTVDGNAFVLGNQVTVNGKVNGSLILLGQNAGIGGTITGEVYGVLLTLDLAPNASIERDLYVASVNLSSGQDSLIGRDLYALGLGSALDGQVARDLHTMIGPIALYNGLMTLLGYDNLTIKLHFETPRAVPPPSGSRLSPGRHAYEHPVPARAVAGFNWGKWALTLLRYWAALFLFGLLAFWLARKPLHRAGEALQVHPWRTFGTGLVVFVLSLASIAAAILVVVILFAIGLGLNYLGLWPLTIALWAVAYSALAVAMVALWAFIVYGTKIIAFYFAAHWLFGKLFDRKAIWLDLLALLAGSVVFALLRSIPYVGWIIDLLVTAFGAGAAWMALRRPIPQPLPEAKPVEIVQPVPPVEAVPVVIPAEIVPAVEPLQMEPVIRPADPEPAIKVAPRKKSAPAAKAALKISRKKAGPAEPAS